MNNLYFEKYSETGERLYRVEDKQGFDPIGEYITLEDDFLTGKEFIIISDSPKLINIVLPMLDVPNVDDAYRVIKLVFDLNNIDDLQDLDFFKECTSLVISEQKL